MAATADSLDKTSQSIGSAASYLRKKDTEQLMTDMGTVIKRNPTQSVVAGVLLGFLVGRLFK